MNKQYHFVGIGGIGMSSLAQLLLRRGHHVSGSDVKESDIIQRLRTHGAEIYIGHDAGHIEHPDFVIYSSAVRPDNSELRAALEKNIPVLKRAQLLALLMDGTVGITVAGAHGKTTTTSMVSFVLTAAGLNPTVSIGGLISNFDENAWVGGGRYFVSEVDESDGSFLFFHPAYSIVTNIDEEHMDYYRNCENIKDAYRQFIGNTKSQGCIFICAEDAILTELARESGKNYRTYGFNDKCNIYSRDIVLDSFSSRFSCVCEGESLGDITLAVPGRHNILNSLAAVGVARALGVDFKAIQEGIANFRGVRRRFQVKGKINDILVVEDYGHHPTEIRATLETARNAGQKRVVTVFQPHRYTRTKYLFDEFVTSLSLSDYVIITDIYAASEKPIEGISAEKLCQGIQEKGHRCTVFFPKDKVIEHLLKIVQSGDLVLTLGAGDIGKLSDELLERL